MRKKKKLSVGPDLFVDLIQRNDVRVLAIVGAWFWFFVPACTQNR